jgi:hypothetical protein
MVNDVQNRGIANSVGTTNSWGEQTQSIQRFRGTRTLRAFAAVLTSSTPSTAPPTSAGAMVSDASSTQTPSRCASATRRVPRSMMRVRGFETNEQRP